MNIKERIELSEAFLPALDADSQRANEIVSCYQEAWDRGDSFTATGMDMFFAKREADREEEAAACVAQAEKDLSWLVIRARIRSLESSEADALEKALEVMNATIHIMGQDVSADSIRSIRANKEDKQ